MFEGRTMPDYTNLDAAIIDCLSRNKDGIQFTPLFSTKLVRHECEVIAQVTGRESFRVLDGRLQAIRRKKLIAYTPKNGWQISALNQNR